MPTIFQCPHCQEKISVPPDHKTNRIGCGGCWQFVDIPDAVDDTPTSRHGIANEDWYYTKGDTPQGPVDFARLQQLKSKGELAPSDLVWKEGMSDWVAAETIDGLFSVKGKSHGKETTAAVKPLPEQIDAWEWGVVGTLVAIGVLSRWLGWTTFLSIFLWLVLVAGLLAAAACAYAAIQDTYHHLRKKLWVLCRTFAAVALGALLFIPLCSNVDDDSSCQISSSPSERKATVRYWTQLREIVKTKPLEPTTELATTPQQTASRLRAAEKTLARFADAIRHFSVTGVDPEVVEYALEIVAVLNDGQSLMRDAARYFDELQALQEHAGSFEAGLESFMRGLLGDPLGKHDDLNARARQFEQRRQQLLARWTRIEQTANALDANEIQLRSRLTRKYVHDFPSLDD